MASETEPAKLLLPYLQRADELQKHEPLVAYYCRLYAMERGLKIPQKERTKTTSTLLVSLMAQLEKDKKSLTLVPEDQLHVEGFALNVFSKADKQDRAGRADTNTAKTFYAASIFFEILNQFGPLQPDIEQKQKYAAWKAADIRKALKEGRKPVPGPPGGDDDPSLTSTDSYDLETSRSDPNIGPDLSRANSSPSIQPDSRNLPPEPYDNLQGSDSYPTQPSNTMPTTPNFSISHRYPVDSLPDDYTQSPAPNTSDHSHYTQGYHYQPYHQTEPQQHYPSQNMPSHPNFQPYPSFTESSLSSNYPSYYQGSDASYPNLPPANIAAVAPPGAYPSSAQYDSVSTNGSIPQASPAQKYEYDSNYEPPPEQVAEAQKAARFAVGALAFDDVFVAVEHLNKALELLTKPSSGHQT